MFTVKQISKQTGVPESDVRNLIYWRRVSAQKKKNGSLVYSKLQIDMLFPEVKEIYYQVRVTETFYIYESKMNYDVYA